MRCAIALILIFMYAFGEASEIPNFDKAIPADATRVEMESQLLRYMKSLKLVPIPVPGDDEVESSSAKSVRNEERIRAIVYYNDSVALLDSKEAQYFETLHPGHRDEMLVSYSRNEDFLAGYRAAHGSLPRFRYVAPK